MPRQNPTRSVLQVMALLFVLSCQDASQRLQSPGSWTSIGRTAEVTREPHLRGLKRPGLTSARPSLAPKLRLAVIEAHRKAPTTESAVALAHTYFPEFAAKELSRPDANPVQRVRTEAQALTVTADGRALELTTRGHTFRVESQTSMAKIQLGSEQAQVEPGHFFAPAGRHPSESAAWKTPRVEEYWIRDVAEGVHHAEYDVTLPKEITHLHDAGEYLEFLNSEGVPVLRFHPSAVRDAEGRTRTGTVELAGVAPAGDHLYAVTARLSVATSVSLEGLAPPLVVDPGWSSTALMATGRFDQTATLLPSGKVLVAGGYDNDYNVLATAELYDPVTAAWSAAGSLSTARADHTATLLPSGKVLVAGGYGGSSLVTAELYDPVTNTWSAASSLSTAREGYTATLLLSGKVLVAGGYPDSSNFTTATTELYDPVMNTWSAAGALTSARSLHTATLLPSGKVLVAGGNNNNVSQAKAELYDPATNTWSAAGSSTARTVHTATLLPSGKVLVTGGYNGTTALASANLYDPATNTWSAAGSLAAARFYHTATLLPSGKVLVVGGLDSNWSIVGTMEVYEAGTNTWSSAGGPGAPRYFHTATLLPSGKVFVIGGGVDGATAVSWTDIYDPGAISAWITVPSLATARWIHTATLLPSGKVLVAGGEAADALALAKTELYDPGTNMWSAGGDLLTARRYHTATLLPSGKVLVTGGSYWLNLANNVVSSAELYDPATNTWSAAASLATARYLHEATLLPSGKVLVVGGFNGNPVTTAELYDPATNTWSSAGSPASTRCYQTVTLLPSGKVLVAGGHTGGPTGGPIAGVELYDPVTNTWSAAASLATARYAHTATLLPSGNVLVTGGHGIASGEYPVNAELYNPATNTWTTTGSLAAGRMNQTATLLLSGRVLVAGGSYLNVATSSVEMYDPETKTWSAAPSLATARSSYTASLLPSGKVLVAGADQSGATLASVEIYDETGAQDTWRPVVTGLTSSGPPSVTGTRFRGISGASSGGSNDSPTDFPLVRFRSLVNEQTWTRPGTAMSATSVTITPPDVPSGYYLLTVTANGISGGAVVFLAPNDAPVISGTPPNQTVEASGPSGAVASWTAPTANDAQDGATAVTCAQASGSTFAIGNTAVTCAATDTWGKSASVTFTVIVRDTTAPTLTVPGNLTREAASASGAAVTYTASATDLVDGTTTVSCTPASGSTFAVGTSLVSCESTDSRGNKGTKTFNVTVSDTTAPAFSCPSNLTVEATSSSGALATFAATATDAVTATPTISYSQASGTTFPAGTATITATAKDAANNSATCTFTVTVQDTTKPTITCPSTMTAEATSSAGAVVTYAATGHDAVSTPTITYSRTSGSTFALGTAAVTATATDAASNSASCTFTVAVQDTTKPVVTCPANLTLEATSSAGTVGTFSATAADAVTSPLTVSFSDASGSTFPLGTKTVTASVTDASSNTGTCSFTVTVQDTTKPTITCPSNLTVEATSSAGAVATYAATSNDAVSTPTVNYSQDSGSTFALGTATVTATATDAAHNGESCTFTVTVQDTTKPTITCPSNLTVEATSSAGAIATYAAATGSDAVSAPAITYSHDSGTSFTLGETTVTATATDDAGNVDSCTFKVLVHDTTAPAVTCPATLNVEAVDTQGAPASWPAITATDAVSSSSVTTSRVSGSVFALGETTVGVSATDAANNQSSCQFVVRVVDTTAPQLTCPSDAIAEATASDGATVTFGAPVASDAVSTVTTTLSALSGSTFAQGATTVRVTAEDVAGNKGSCTFKVTVQDTTEPQLECPADLVEEATSPSGALVMFNVPGASDLVSTPTVTTTQSSMTQFPLGETTVEVTATDAANNKAECSFAVKVQDTTPPTLVVPADLTVEATSAEGAMVSFPAVTATDLVTATPTIAYDHASGVQLPLGTTTVTVTATDAAENKVTETFRVTVADTTAPQLQCPANVEVAATDASGATVTLPAPVVLDAVTAAPVVTFDQAAAGLYPVGKTQVVATATDAAGNKATCEFTVTVNAKVTGPEPSASTVVTSGCGCSSDSPASTVAGLVVLGLALMRRRMQRVARM